jgi:hypothetical protein
MKVKITMANGNAYTFKKVTENISVTLNLIFGNNTQNQISRWYSQDISKGSNQIAICSQHIQSVEFGKEYDSEEI